MTETLEEIADELVACRSDPELFVDTTFDWNAPELKGKSPEKWQRAVLQAIRDGLPLNKAVRIAVRERPRCRQDRLNELDLPVGHQYLQRCARHSHCEQRSTVANEKQGRTQKMVQTMEGPKIL
jgi:hypothetical protein